MNIRILLAQNIAICLNITQSCDSLDRSIDRMDRSPIKYCLQLTVSKHNCNLQVANCWHIYSERAQFLNVTRFALTEKRRRKQQTNTIFEKENNKILSSIFDNFWGFLRFSNYLEENSFSCANIYFC